MFYEIFCDKQVLIVVVVTGLEEVVDRRVWWVRNQKHYLDQGMLLHVSRLLWEKEESTGRNTKRMWFCNAMRRRLGIHGWLFSGSSITWAPSSSTSLPFPPSNPWHKHWCRVRAWRKMRRLLRPINFTKTCMDLNCAFLNAHGTPSRKRTRFESVCPLLRAHMRGREKPFHCW